MNNISALLDTFCQQQQLPAHYIDIAKRWFIPLATQLSQQQKQATPLFIGINGCQGSGKSTMSALLQQLLYTYHNKNTIVLSLDDFYHTKQKREELAKTIHPLLKTRGVPGTHDTQLLELTLSRLLEHKPHTSIPRFNKATDDRHPKKYWDINNKPADIIILEGWCVGATTQDPLSLTTPVNTLEASEDKDARWRNFVNDQLDTDYKKLFSKFDSLIMLKAPSFTCVYQWREEQEAKLRSSLPADTKGIMNSNELKRFIEHYQRITEHTLANLTQFANIVLELDKEHNITARYNNN